MIVVTRTFTRPNVNVPFFVGNKASVDAHILDTYQGTNPSVLSRSLSVSADKLTLTGTMTFTSPSAVQALEADPVFAAWHNARTAYNQANGIAEAVTQIEQ